VAMKKEELRIGNFYMSVKFGIPVECTLADLYELYVKSDGAYGDPPIEEMFESIPITDDWLWAFGFDRAGKWVGKSFNPRMAIRFYDGNPGECDIVQDDKFIAFKQGHIKYVHQLQNLYFALTGEELIRKEK